MVQGMEGVSRVCTRAPFARIAAAGLYDTLVPGGGSRVDCGSGGRGRGVNARATGVSTAKNYGRLERGPTHPGQGKEGKEQVGAV